jgi:ATP-dependent exoDNAse (exonuclease V) alpha subunit
LKNTTSVAVISAAPIFPVDFLSEIVLSYATTIHKSQGATITHLELDIGSSVFADGQAYTALSRAKSISGLSIVDIQKRSFKIGKKVKDFYSLP